MRIMDQEDRYPALLLRQADAILVDFQHNIVLDRTAATVRQPAGLD
jgi:hypothetical protein